MRKFSQLSLAQSHRPIARSPLATNFYTMSDKTLDDGDVCWSIVGSDSASRTVNPIRAIVDQLQVPKDSKLSLIPLSIGDPTVFSNFPLHSFIKEQMIAAISSGKSNGYAHSAGVQAARESIARKFDNPISKLTHEDVFITSGCSGALQISTEALVNPGDNILVPKPGFPLYKTIADNLGAEVRHYHLLAEREWEVDLNQMDSLVDERTKFILVTNPSNPCGSVWSPHHMREILGVARKHRLPIVADEVYAGMVFDDREGYSFGDVSEEVPIISVGGIAKRYLAPGWRLGWIILHDRKGRLEKARHAIRSLTQIILGANTLVQSILPEILHNTPEEFYTSTNKQLQENATYWFHELNKVEGLTVVRPGGAMYVMMNIDVEVFPDIANDVEFAKKLLQEQMVFVLPGSIFGAENFVRIVVCAAIEKLRMAAARIKEFCEAHHRRRE